MLTDTASSKVTAAHLARTALLYVRQSSLKQVLHNTESAIRQYDLRGRAVALGWAAGQITVIDIDQGQSGASAADREGFQQLVAEVSLGRAGIVLGLECSRLARNSADWHQLLGAPRGSAQSCGDGRALPPGRRSGPAEAGGSLIRGSPGRAGSSLDNVGTGRYCQTTWVRLARSEGVTRVNQWWKLRNGASGSNLADTGRDAVRDLLRGGGSTPEPVLADGEEATLKSCGVGVAMLPGYSWTPT